MADECYQHFPDFLKTLHLAVFLVANNESEAQILKFKIADPIWQTEGKTTLKIAVQRMWIS